MLAATFGGVGPTRPVPAKGMAITGLVRPLRGRVGRDGAAFAAITPRDDVARSRGALVEVMNTYEQDVSRLREDLADGSMSDETESTLEEISVDRGSIGDYLGANREGLRHRLRRRWLR